jgi:LCP family protein required for cell wall assembly
VGKHRVPSHRPTEIHWTRKFIALLSIFVLIATAIGGGVMFAINSLGRNIQIIDTSDLNNSKRPKGFAETDTSPINILIMGSDSRTGEGNTGYGEAEGQRSDTTLVVHLYQGRQSALIASIPRDSYVTIPDCKQPDGTIAKSSTQKFNAAFSIGGPVCTIKTIESLTNVRIDKFVVVDFNAFKKIVDAIGGVEICLTNPISDPIRAGGGGTNLDLPAGISNLNGDQALQFVRARENLGDGSDLSRIQRQQAFMGAMVRDMNKKSVLTNPGLVYQILDAITQSISTNSEWASLNTLQEFALSIGNLKPKDITMITTPNQIIENGNVAWTSEANEMWKAMANDSIWPPVAPTPTPTPTVTVSPLPAPSEVTVLVLNGTSISGKAKSVSTSLKSIGFAVSDYGNSDSRLNATEIRYPLTNRSMAEALKSSIGFGSLVPDQSITGGINLIIGKDWPEVLPSPSATPTPSQIITPSATPSPTVTTPSVSAADAGCLNLS